MSEMYLVYCLERQQWRQSRHDYTANQNDAKRFTQSDALAICHDANITGLISELMVPDPVAKTDQFREVYAPGHASGESLYALIARDENNHCGLVAVSGALGVAPAVSMTKDGMKRYLTFYDQGFGKPSTLEFLRFTRAETIPRAAFDKKES